jgi:dihydroorotate dehydrogenase (NAD+) catalytic subunit
LKPVALAAVFACYRETGLPIVGMGGIASGRDALEFLAAGAAAVALGTALFADPGAPARVRRELDEELRQRGIASPVQATGLAHGGQPREPRVVAA